MSRRLSVAEKIALERKLDRLIARFGKDAIQAALDAGAEGRTKKRKRGPPKRPPSLSYIMLAECVDELAKIHRANGHSAPMTAAYEEAAWLESEESGVPVTADRIKRYCRFGRAQQRELLAGRWPVKPTKGGK